MQCTVRTRVCGAGLVTVAGRPVAFAPTSTSSHRHSRWEGRGRRWLSHACKQRFNFLLLTSLQGLDLHHMSERRQLKNNLHTDYDILMRHLGNITTVTDNNKKKRCGYVAYFSLRRLISLRKAPSSVPESSSLSLLSWVFVWWGSHMVEGPFWVTEPGDWVVSAAGAAGVTERKKKKSCYRALSCWKFAHAYNGKKNPHICLYD